MAVTIPTRGPILEIDFVNKVLVESDKQVKLDDDSLYAPTHKLSGDLLTRFMEDCLGEFWHTANDQLQAVFIYNDGTAYCQRKKKKYNFASGQEVFSTYEFTGHTTEQVADLEKKIRNFIEANTLLRVFKVEASIQKIEDEFMFFEYTLMKRIEERNNILAVTDWHMLPDIEEKYEGEKEHWKKYRKFIREITFGNPTDYPTPLDYFKAIKTFKFPIDPRNYRDQYPDGLDNDGNPVEYLSTDDQWVERDTDSSKDLIENRLSNIAQMRGGYLQSKKTVTAEVKKMMQELQLEDFVEGGIDYNDVYTEDEVNDLAN